MRWMLKAKVVLCFMWLLKARENMPQVECVLVIYPVLKSVINCVNW